jgi:hypothetical protein
MVTDVRLDEGDGSFVVVQGRVLKIAGSELMLDSPERRIENQNPNRRALVHDPKDGLTINSGNDYPGGVTINGTVAVPGRFFLAGFELSPESTRRQISDLSKNIDRLEATILSLVELVGAAVIPLWATKTAVEQGDQEPATAGGLPIPSAQELGLVVEFEFDRLDPGFEHEDVVRISPEVGNVVKKGSTVVVTVNLTG